MGRELEFGGVATASAASALARAARGGLLSGRDLAAVASLADGAVRLTAAVRSAARAAEGMQVEERAGGGGAGPGGRNPAAPLAAPFQGFEASPLKGLARDVATSIDEGGEVRDGASEALRSARLGARTAAARARAAVKSAGGEVVERAGRFCVALPDGAVPPRGAVLLASSGGLAFYEPPSAVGPNNALAAAAGAAAAAEENVRWGLTGKVAEAAATVRRALDLLVWADVTAARSRYGVWVGGVLAEFVPVGGGRGGGGGGGGLGKGGRGARVGAARARRAGAALEAAAPPDSPPPSSPSSSSDDDAGLYHVQLFQYRHPLLLGTHLIAAESAARRARAGGARTAAAASAAGSALRSLSTRRKAGRAASGASPPSPPPAPDLPPPPVPIDLAIKSGVRCVTITGPNTGGKTAALKAAGLAALAARAGLPLPARAPARLPWFSAVLADIGDGQSLGAGLSTFGGHLARVGALRKEAGPAALVLLDELGTGTDPAEGAALGAALLAALAAGGPRGAGLTLATTHASALAELKAAQPSLFENAAAEFDASRCAPTHRLLWGLPGRSCGLDIAERLGLERRVIEDARARLAGKGPAGSGGGGGGGAAPMLLAVRGGAAEALDAARRAAEADTDAAAVAAASAVASRAEAATLRAAAVAAGAATDLETAAAVARAADRAAAELRKRASRRRKVGALTPPTDAPPAPRPAVATPRGGTRVMGANTRAADRRGSAAAQAKARAGSGGRPAPAGWTPAVGDTVTVPRLKLTGAVVAVSGKQVTVSAGLLGRVAVKAGEVEWAGRKE